MKRNWVIIAGAASLLAACGAGTDHDTPIGAAAADVPVQAVNLEGRVGVTPLQAGDSYYVSAAAAVAQRAARSRVKPARNVILFIGDGMGVSTVTAARIYAGQSKGIDGESYSLAMDTLPHAALSKTYSHDSQVSDSASTATAMVSGVKSRSRTLGVTQNATYSDCATLAGNGTDTLFELAERAGLSTGIVSTARLTHATPAAAYAELVNRDWEDDTELNEDADTQGCADAARQFIEWDEGDHFEIALAGGRRHFRTDKQPDPENEFLRGKRKDGRDLAEAWANKSEDHVTVFDRDGLNSAMLSQGARVLGLFEQNHMQYEIDRNSDVGGEPSIEEMTRAAITRLSQDEEGYVLMVEAGRIDHGHHGANAARALSDTVAFDEAIAAALDMTSEEDTLIIVTADHSHTLTIQGYPRRNNPILGKVTYPGGAEAQAADGKPYTTLSYANGPSACLPNTDCTRPDLSDVDTVANNFRQQALLPSPSETHAGEDVPVFARGPGAELVSGVMEQNEIFHIMGYATGLVE
ncbi:MAG: alkaline phosphatase [Hyphomonadaceae bacterium]